MESSHSARRTDSAPPTSPPSATPRLLRALLGFDATTCVLLGTALVAGSAAGARLTGLPAAMLFETGLLLLGFGGCVAWTAVRRVLSRFAVLCIVAANGLWTLGSIVLAAEHMVDATALGRMLVIAQAAAVAAIGAAEWIALRRAVAPE